MDFFVNFLENDFGHFWLLLDHFWYFRPFQINLQNWTKSELQKARIWTPNCNFHFFQNKLKTEKFQERQKVLRLMNFDAFSYTFDCIVHDFEWFSYDFNLFLYDVDGFYITLIVSFVYDCDWFYMIVVGFLIWFLYDFQQILIWFLIAFIWCWFAFAYDFDKVSYDFESAFIWLGMCAFP